MDGNQFRLKDELFGLGQMAVGVIVVALVLTGIGGTIYKVISPDGWVAHAFGRSLSAGFAALGSLALIAGLAWFSRSSPRNRSRFTDLCMYTFAVAGMLYLAQLWLKGSF
jgi:hypothetical protein